MKYRIGKRFKFSAAHRLSNLPEGDPCMNVHGHTFWAEVVVESETLDENGMVVPLDEIRRKAGDLIEIFDHTFLNDLIEQPTSERLAKVIFDHAQRHFGQSLYKVRVDEGPHNYAEVIRD